MRFRSGPWAALATATLLSLSIALPAHATGAHKTGPLVRTAQNATLGAILTAPNGRTLYTFSKDKNGRFGCSGSCLQFWFPLTVPNGASVTASLAGVPGRLGTVKRGTQRQITYRRHPLYTFVGDHKAGQTTGQGLRDFGGTWSVAAVHPAASAGSGSGSTSGSGSGTGSGNGGGGYGGY
jgi:predicted lipoprotein with Yx(FWY)xxD motif